MLFLTISYLEGREWRKVRSAAGRSGTGGRACARRAAEEPEEAGEEVCGAEAGPPVGEGGEQRWMLDLARKNFAADLMELLTPRIFLNGGLYHLYANDDEITGKHALPARSPSCTIR